MEASFASTCLLVAIRYFEASDTAKSLLAGGGYTGFLITPIFLLFIGKSKLPVSRICSTLMVLAAFCILISATALQSLFMWVGVSGLYPCGSSTISNGTYLFGKLSLDERGQKISGNLMIQRWLEV